MRVRAIPRPTGSADRAASGSTRQGAGELARDIQGTRAGLQRSGNRLKPASPSDSKNVVRGMIGNFHPSPVPTFAVTNQQRTEIVAVIYTFKLCLIRK
jgi:hypothetical protein